MKKTWKKYKVIARILYALIVLEITLVGLVQFCPFMQTEYIVEIIFCAIVYVHVFRFLPALQIHSLERSPGLVKLLAPPLPRESDLLCRPSRHPFEPVTQAQAPS